MPEAENFSNVHVIVPMLNEENSIGRVLDDLPPVRQVIVVDNGSTDAGPAIAAQRGARVIREDRRGYGQACLAGLAELDSLCPPASQGIVVFLDADYSDHPDELPQLIEPIENGTADFVIGSRALGQRQRGAMPMQAVFGNWLACTLMRLFWRGARFTDLGPFRAIRARALHQLQMQDTNFGWTIEMQIKAVQHGLRILEVPVSYRRRIGTSKISGTVAGTIRAGYKILYTLFRFRFLAAPTSAPTALPEPAAAPVPAQVSAPVPERARLSDRETE